MYEQFSLSKNGLNSDCHNHFQEVRRQLDIHREKLKEKVDDIYLEMIEKTKEFEATFLKSLNEKLKTPFKYMETKLTIEDELKIIDEKFRNPNLLIKSIKEIHLKQQEAIETIQSKLNEMNKLRDYLKVSNQFIPNGQLSLSEYSNFDPIKKSSILKDEKPRDLIKLCEFDPNQK